MRVNLYALDAQDAVEKQWQHLLAEAVRRDDDRPSKIELLASSHRDGKGCKVIQRIQGAFNHCLRIRFDDDGEQWMLRFPVPGSTMDPVCKAQAELATMHFIRERTKIPIPAVLASGEAAGDLAGLGPYIIMEFVQGQPLDKLILDEKGKLRQDIEETKVRAIYRQLARIYLELSAHTFDKIGVLSMTGSGSCRAWHIERGPITFKSNEIKRMGGVETKDFSKTTYHSTECYLNALIDQSLNHLRENPMASKDEEDARSDYRAICVLESTISSRHTKDDESDPGYLLFLDDLRFGNILVDDDYNFRAVIDWEFCYAAPRSFLTSPPEWIIGVEPFEWDKDDLHEFDRRLEVFLEILREEEGAGQYTNDLSDSMKNHRADGTFWLNLAAREPFALKSIMQHFSDLEPFRDCPSPNDLDDFGKLKMSQRHRFLMEHQS